MKRKSLILSGLLSAATLTFVLSTVACKGHREDNTTANKSAIVKPHTAGKLSLEDFPDNATTTSECNAMITNYANDANVVPTPAFAYTANTLLTYLSESNGIVQLHALIGEEQGPSGSNILTLILCGVDASGNHIYIQDGTPVVNYAMDHCCPCPPPATCPPTVFSSPTSLSAYLTASYSENIPVAAAATMITTYQSSPSKNTTASAFLINAADLSDFITNAPGIYKVQFFLATTPSGTLTLIILGADSSGNQIYIQNSGSYYVFGNATSCPTCAIVNKGVSLE